MINNQNLKISILLLLYCVFSAGSLSSAEKLTGKNIGKPLYKDKSAPVTERVEDLLSRMTLHEKILQMENVAVHSPGDIDKVFNGESYGTAYEMEKNSR